MKRIVALTIVTLFVVSCGKKDGTPMTAPQAAEPQASAPAATTESKPFVIPPSAKKQAKYFPEGSSTRAIQDLDDMLDSYIIDPQTPEQSQYNVDLKRTVLYGTFDIRELSSLALDKHWAERTPQEQNYFVDIMTRLLEKKAVFSKEQGQKKKSAKDKNVYKVTYAGHKFIDSDEANSLVTTKVHIPSQNLTIDLNYKLKKQNGGWKVYDVIVDGASLLDNYRYQFGKIIDKEGYAGLIKRMETKLGELEKKTATEKVGQ